MKKISLFLCAATLVAIQSCKKDDDNAAPSKSDMLKGTWTLSQYGEDSNNNSVLDAGEAANANTIGMSGTLTINANNTGYVKVSVFGVTDSSSFTWSVNSDTLSLASDGETTKVTMTELTSNRFVGLWDDTTPKTWVVLTK